MVIASPLTKFRAPCRQCCAAGTPGWLHCGQGQHGPSGSALSTAKSHLDMWLLWWR